MACPRRRVGARGVRVRQGAGYGWRPRRLLPGGARRLRPHRDARRRPRRVDVHRRRLRVVAPRRMGQAGRARGLTVSGVHVHPTAIVEGGVVIGEGTCVWDSVHIRGPGTTIGEDCIVGEKSYIAYGVSIGHRVKINAFVYICTAVTIEDGVMVSAGTTFTNDRYPRATTSDLSKLRSSDPDEHTLPTIVRAGTTIGARAIIGPGVELGRFSMIGMAATVTRSVPDFHLVVGH